MPKRGGIDACRVIKQRVPSARILMLTSSDDEANLFEAVRAGANGYLLKDVPPEEVAAGIRSVFHGQSLLSPLDGLQAARGVQADQPDGRAAGADARAGAAAPDRPRARDPPARRPGRLNREIAGELFISENTVRNHIRNILDKLQMHSRMEAAMYAVRQRLIDPGE